MLSLCRLFEGILPLSGSRGDTATLLDTTEGILPLSGSRRDTATLLVTAEGIHATPLSVCQRVDTATLRVAAERILTMSVCQRVCFHTVGSAVG